jgi:DNA-directed RNA polymerase subunit M/transcription elongation factor TFIIS
MRECPECGGVMVTTRSVARKSGRTRWMKCKNCNHRIIERISDMKADRNRRFDADTIEAIRKSPDGRRVLSHRYGCSETMIRDIRIGKAYRDLLPEGFRSPPGPDDPSCETCRFWEDGCSMGFPDPAEEGLGFARDCALYQVEG